MESSSRLQKMRETLKRAVLRLYGRIAVRAGTSDADREYARRIAGKHDLTALRKK
jgi:hypothetical protein